MATPHAPDAVTIAPTYTDHSSVMAKLALKSALALVEKSAIGRPKVPQASSAVRRSEIRVRCRAFRRAHSAGRIPQASSVRMRTV